MFVLIQSNLHGHRSEHLEHMIKNPRVINSGFIIWVNDAVQSVVEDRFERYEGYVSSQTGPTDSLRLEEIRKLYKNITVIFLDGDRVLPFVLKNAALFRKASTIIMLTRINFPGFGSFRPLMVFWTKMVLASGLQMFAVASIKKMVVLEKSRRKMFGQVRDPLMKPTQTDSARLTQNSEQKILGIVGTIDPRKSIHLAVQALEHLGPKFHLKLSGEVTPSFSRELDRLVNQNPRIHLNDQHLSEKEMVEAISSLDCFLVLLQNNLPSGTILRSLSLGVPVVVGGSKVLQKVVAAYPDLAVWTELNPEGIVQAVNKAIRMSRIPASGLPTPLDFSEDILES